MKAGDKVRFVNGIYNIPDSGLIFNPPLGSKYEIESSCYKSVYDSFFYLKDWWRGGLVNGMIYAGENKRSYQELAFFHRSLKVI